jgi:hypothetical protein
MVSKRLFDRRYGQGAFSSLCSMLDDPAFAYQQIANTFGLTKQHISKVAKKLGIYGMRRRRKRERSRMLSREPRIIKVNYAPGIRSVIDEIRRCGMQVTPYVLPAQPKAPNQAREAQAMVYVNHRLCTIQFRQGRKLTPDGREYVRFDATVGVKRAQFALWAMRSEHVMRVYVVPVTHLNNVSSVYIPSDGKYAVGGRKPRKD